MRLGKQKLAGLLLRIVRTVARQALSLWRGSGLARLKPLLRRALVVALIVRLAAPLTPAEAEVLGGAVKETWREMSAYAKAMVSRSTTGGTSHHHARGEAGKPPTRVAFASMQSQNVASLQVSPTQLNMYVGENYTLSPVPLDSGGNVVQGTGMQWSSANTAIATVNSFGQVRAVAAGNTSVQAQSGNATVQVPVQVLSGARQALSGARSLQSRAASIAQQSLFPINSDGTEPDIDPEPVSGSRATDFSNAVGNPRFSPVKRAGSTSVQLGSDNYQFSVPVASVGGRGISAGIAMSFNSRVWNNDNGTMTFNYVSAFPAPGWSMGYGKIIRNYNATATGDGSGIGSPNSPGDYLLVAAGGTRTRLAATYDSTSGRWYHLSDDGSFLKFNPASGEMRHPDGSRMIYSNVNGILQSTAIINTNGSAITMSYRDYCEGAGCQRVFRFHTAFNAIRDTLGRYLTFHYYGDAGYTADPNNGRPAGTLAAIKAPDMQGVQQEVIRVEYQAITLQYNFGGAPVNAPSSGSQIQVVKRIYYPETGKGFLFLDYSTYGMARKISSRIKMIGQGGAITDGAEIAYTTYDYTTIDPNDPYGRNQGSVSLNDSPQFTKRKVWWQGKTDDVTGLPTNDPTEYDYSRTIDSSTETDTIKNVGKNVDEITVTGTDSAQLSFGKVISVEARDDTTGATLSKRTYTYTTGPDGESEIAQVESIVDGAGTLVSFAYDHYGRVADKSEYGYKQASGYNVYRRIHNDYINDLNYINARFLRLANRVSIYDANNNLLSKAETTFDDYSSMGGMQSYGLSADQYPPNHDATYDQNNTLRGNPTAVTTFSQLSPSEVSTTRHAKYDIFGNVVEAEVSCCVVKSFSFSGATAYSEPDSVTSGDTGGLNLQTTYQHNYFTGLVEQETNPDGLLTTYGYDKALRLNQVTNTATGAVALTQFDQDNYGNDLLTYLSKVTYADQGTQKIITSRQWFDGVGAVIQAGTGAGSAPNSYDMTATVYDSWGRVLKRSNPYAGDASGNPQSGVTRFWTTNTYDLLSRVKQVTLPDQQTIKTDYNGATTASGATVVTTDPVGRKHKVEADGYGRPVKVTEQNPANGNLEWETSYSYDARDNLIQTNQGGQLRTFAYDTKGRLTRETTPEAGQVTYAYTDFDAVSSSTDARQVVTTYTYGELNMLTGVNYDTTHAAGVAATAPVSINYKTTSPGKGQVEKVTDGVTESAGSETYSYDSVGRLQSCTRKIDGISYQKQYEYNAVGQMTLMIYPSGKRVNVGRDDRGRLSDLKKVDDTGATQETYLSGVTYRADDLISSQNLGDTTTENFGYSNDRLQLTSQTATKGGTTLLSLNYGYGAGAGQMGSGTTAGNSGQLVSVSGTVNGQGRNQAFTYDNVGRLVTATGWGAWARRFGYDKYGNRTAVWDAVSGGNQLQNTVIAQSGGMTTNRIASLNGTNFSYDANGNVTGDGARTYTYDAKNQMVSVSAASGGESYSYDAGRHRVKKVVGGVVTHYVWGESDQVIAEYERGGGATTATGTRYYHPDHMSTRIITSVAGNVVGTTDQLPFGEEFTSTGQSEKHKFGSYERDDSGLDLAVNRHYNSAIGRFMQPDPMGIRAANLTNPQSLNRYAYVTNDAINKVDPLGLFAEEEYEYEEGYFDGGGGGGGWYSIGDEGFGTGNVMWVNAGEEVPDGYTPYTSDSVVSYDLTQWLYINPNGPDPTAPEGSDAALGILRREDIGVITIDSSEQELTDFAKGVIGDTSGRLAAVDPYLEVMAQVALLFTGPIEGGGAIIELGIEGGTETGIIEGVAAEEGQTLFHYTNEKGLDGILESGELNPSLKAVNPNDVRYGNGQYLSDIVPGTKTPAQLSREFLGQPFQGQKYTHFIEIDTTGLNVIQGRNGVFVVPGETPLNLTGRIVSHGAN